MNYQFIFSCTDDRTTRAQLQLMTELSQEMSKTEGETAIQPIIYYLILLLGCADTIHRPQSSGLMLRHKLIFKKFSLKCDSMLFEIAAHMLTFGLACSSLARYHLENTSKLVFALSAQDPSTATAKSASSNTSVENMANYSRRFASLCNFYLERFKGDWTLIHIDMAGMSLVDSQMATMMAPAHLFTLVRMIGAVTQVVWFLHKHHTTPERATDRLLMRTDLLVILQSVRILKSVKQSLSTITGCAQYYKIDHVIHLCETVLHKLMSTLYTEEKEYELAEWCLRQTDDGCFMHERKFLKQKMTAKALPKGEIPSVIQTRFYDEDNSDRMLLPDFIAPSEKSPPLKSSDFPLFVFDK